VSYILWCIDPLLGKDLETDNETTAIAMQQHGQHTSTTIELLLEMVLCMLDSCNIWATTVEMGVFSIWSVPRSYLEDSWGDSVSWKSACEEKTSRLVWNGHQPGSCHLRVGFCMGGCEDRTWAREAEESPLLEAIATEWLVKTACWRRLSGCCGDF
jgi:hypothetical protein